MTGPCVARPVLVLIEADLHTEVAMGVSAPTLSFIVIFHNMTREAPRTLYSLSRSYQTGSRGVDYEVIAVDNGSSQPIAEDLVRRFGDGFSYRYFATESRSPCEAINAAASMAGGDLIAVCIDGARILSPGIVRFMAMAARISPRPVVSTLAWHLGHKRQNLAIEEGYDQRTEDALLATTAWEQDGYRLFSIGCLAASSSKGWFLPFTESNCIAVPRALFAELGGFDTGFQSPGGGLVNLDFLRRAWDSPCTQPVVLLGEGTFHQCHGGVATNVPLRYHPRAEFRAEYIRLRGAPLRPSHRIPIYLGGMPDMALPFLSLSVEAAVRGKASRRGRARRDIPPVNDEAGRKPE